MALTGFCVPSALDTGYPLLVRAHRLFRAPEIVPQAAGFRRVAAQIKGFEKCTLVTG